MSTIIDLNIFDASGSAHPYTACYGGYVRLGYYKHVSRTSLVLLQIKLYGTIWVILFHSKFIDRGSDRRCVPSTTTWPWPPLTGYCLWKYYSSGIFGFVKKLKKLSNVFVIKQTNKTAIAWWLWVPTYNSLVPFTLLILYLYKVVLRRVPKFHLLC
jgi:hypothetical protein